VLLHSRLRRGSGGAGGVVQDCGGQEDAVDGEGGEAAFFDVGEEPGYRGVGDYERSEEADGQDYPAVGVDLGYSNGVGGFGE
jgi:hypothetical protein